jgi:hypothetical protein
MTLQIHRQVEQGTPEWLALRRGILTASVIGQMITKGAPDPLTVACPRCFVAAADPCISTARKAPTPIKTIHDERTARAGTLPPAYKVANTDTARALTISLVAERITGWGEEVFPSRDMTRGTLSEPYARDLYAEQQGVEVEQVAFIVRDEPGFKLGFSPDGLVGDAGAIEIKAPKQKTHLATILADEVPAWNMAQCQAGLLVTGRKWLDFVSYCGGWPLFIKRVYPDPAWFSAITAAVEQYEATAAEMIARYEAATEGKPPVERIDFYEEMEIAV